jgi:integration host factor subunit beta
LFSGDLPSIAVQSNEGTSIMTKSDLIEVLAAKPDHQLHYKDVELAVRYIVECMSNSLASGERIEVRGFGSFSLHFRPPRVGRNPKTGDAVALAGKHVPHFKPGKELRDRVNDAYQLELAAAGSA